MNLTPETALQVLTSLLKRTPMNEAEAAGANAAMSVLESSFKELNDFKNPPKPSTD